MWVRRLRKGVWPIVGALGCSSSSAAPSTTTTNQVNGTVGGSAFAALDAITLDTQLKGADFYGPSTFVLESAYANACTTNYAITGERSLAFDLAKSGGAADDAGGVTGTPVDGPGAYVVTPASQPYPTHANVAVVFYELAGGEAGSGVSGTVTVLSKDSSGIRANFDVTMDSGEHVTGSFLATPCPTFNPNG